jgi:hypothetical protein
VAVVLRIIWRKSLSDKWLKQRFTAAGWTSPPKGSGVGSLYEWPGYRELVSTKSEDAMETPTF